MRNALSLKSGELEQDKSLSVRLGKRGENTGWKGEGRREKGVASEWSAIQGTRAVHVLDVLLVSACVNCGCLVRRREIVPNAARKQERAEEKQAG